MPATWGTAAVAISNASGRARALPSSGRSPIPAFNTVAPARFPMLLGALAFAAGIALGQYTWRPPLWWLVAALVYAAVAAWFLSRRPRFSLALTLAAFVFAGAFALELRLNGDGAAGFDSGEQVIITAHVTAEGSPQTEGAGSWRQQVDLETERIESESERRDSRFGLRLTVYSKSAVPEGFAEITPDPSHAAPVPSARLFHYGERLRFTTVLNSPRNFHNPGAFDYVGYLREQGIQATASAKFTGIEALPGFSGSKPALWRARGHRSIIDHIHRLWPERIAGLIDAMVIGERAFLNTQSAWTFSAPGPTTCLSSRGCTSGFSLASRFGSCACWASTTWLRAPVQWL